MQIIYYRAGQSYRAEIVRRVGTSSHLNITLECNESVWMLPGTED